MIRRALSIVTIATLCLAFCSKATNAYTIEADSLFKHIEVLAHDSLEGRLVGTPGEWSAARYISRVFNSAGLKPAGNDGSWFEPFTFIADIAPVGQNQLTVNGVPLDIGTHYLPIPWSGNGAFDFDSVIDAGYGIQVRMHGFQRDDYADLDVSGMAVLIRRMSPETDNPNIDLSQVTGIVDKINTAIEQNAEAILLITPLDAADTLMLPNPAAVTAREIPVIFLKREALRHLGLDLDQPDITSVSGIVTMQQVIDTGYNVVGHLEGTSDTSIIVGAHYDHIGWGDRGSLYRGDERMIHNGADDNASGVAAVLELARHFADRKQELNYEMTFVAFSGEESGLLGSSHFVKQRRPGPGSVKLMANMDMIGRLRPEKRGLIVYGAGTALEFEQYFESLVADNDLDVKVTVEPSGIGASDHTSFYNRDIPVLHLFTGPHEDYNKPSDDPQTINIEGELKVTNFLADFLWHFQQHRAPLTFQKVSAPPMGTRRSQFTVTLGIMPDYAAEVEGVRVEAAIPDRPGYDAGMRDGDIIVKMGEHAIRDIYDYMSALGKFRAGDSVNVIVSRDNTTLELPVVF